MLTEVEPKKFAIGGRVTVQIVLFVVLLYFVYVIVNPKGIHLQHTQVIPDRLFGLLVLVFNIGFFLQLLYMPFWVTIDDELKTLEIKYLILPKKVLSLYDIISYNTTTIRSKNSSCFGVILNLAGEKKILLSDLNFENYTPVEVFLNKFDVKNQGEESFSFISYYMHQ
jgi:hypothetical protein